MISKIKEWLNKRKDYLKNIKLPIFIFLFSFFGAYAGSQGTSLLWRRIFLPIITVLYSYIKMFFIVGWLKALWVIFLMLRACCYAMGYGVPSPDDPKPSTLGKFWWEITKHNHLWTDILTRSTIGMTHSIVLVIIPLLYGNWLVYGLGCLGLVLSYALISWRPWGSKKIKIFGKLVELCWSDIVHYSIDGICTFVIITYKILG